MLTYTFDDLLYMSPDMMKRMFINQHIVVRERDGIAAEGIVKHLTNDNSRILGLDEFIERNVTFLFSDLSEFILIHE